ncbi:MAG: peptidyl-prolyl cis-trans isomerase [Planctomycetes bacterium]|nr:peptidyl-prolyl cis-trans isomerase [Planctomycetota bacterium]
MDTTPPPDPPTDPHVKLQTNLGDIVIELNPTAAPVTVENFLRYVTEEYYDGLIFHRVIPGYMIQGGGLTADRQQKMTSPPIINESANELKNDRGTISMARTADPDSATSQFFINVVDNAPLNYTTNSPGYTVFGKVIEGMDVVDAITAVETTTIEMYKDVPVVPIVIQKATVVQ